MMSLATDRIREPIPRETRDSRCWPVLLDTARAGGALEGLAAPDSDRGGRRHPWQLGKTHDSLVFDKNEKMQPAERVIESGAGFT